MEISKKIRVCGYKDGHVQGIAVDEKREFMYFSFTTRLVKTDMQGNVIGSVKGLAGHLGCIAYNYDDGRVYGSLEFKHDSIGKGILANIGREDDIRDGFYVAIFDVNKINRDDMDAALAIEKPWHSVAISPLGYARKDSCAAKTIKPITELIKVVD